MHIASQRFYNFITNGKTRCILAFLFYFLFIFIFIIRLDLPSIVKILSSIVFTITFVLGIITCLMALIIKLPEIKNSNILDNIIEEFKKIVIELCMFIPVHMFDFLVTTLFIVGESANQVALDTLHQQAPIWYSIYTIIVAPIEEEFIFRFLPSKFIKNKILYIIFSSVIFAAMHVIHDSNPFYYIWCYMLVSLYLGYRYYKTKDIFVTMAIHCWVNML